MDIYALNTQEVLERISRHCPQALSVYLHCLNRVEKDGQEVYFSRDMIEQQLSESWTRFRNNIKKLATENLLEWRLEEHGINVTLAALEDYE